VGLIGNQAHLRSQSNSAPSRFLKTGRLLFFLALSGLATHAWSQQAQVSPTQQSAGPPAPGSIRGIVVDRDGAVLEGARISLAQAGSGAPPGTAIASDSNGCFSFAAVPPGAFKLTVSSNGFATQTLTGVLHSGESYEAQPVVLFVSTAASEVRVTKVRTLESVVASSTAAPRSLTLLLAAFGGLAILVGGIGVYSLISYNVSWRTREIGLRLALGANRLQIVQLVLRQSLVLAIAGSALGIAGAVAATRMMSQFLFQTSPLDPLTYSLVPVLFCLLALVAAWVPAQRAAGVDPIVALRNE
jgi:hypothetical protein